MTALVHVTDCPRCHNPLSEALYAQDALFIHGGYGATTERANATCANCGWFLAKRTATTRPPQTTK